MRLVLAPVACAVLLAPSLAIADDSDDLLAFAEAAYRDVEFERTVDLAEEALETGALSPKRLARTYTLLAVAAAAIHDDERSKEAWIRLLALQPDTQAAKDLSPQMRGPYLEAKGYWSAQGDPLRAQAKYLRTRTSVRVDLTDPAGMAAMVSVRWRKGGEVAFKEARFLADERVYVPAEGLGPEDRIEYVVRLLDEQGNRLVEIGDDDSPRSDEPEQHRGFAGLDGDADGFVGSTWFWVGAGVLAAGAATGGYLLVAPEEPEGRTRVTIGIR